MKKAVFFDAGGTLIHIDFPRVALAIRQVLGRDIPVRDFVAAEYAGRAAVEASMASGEISTDNTRWRVHFAAMLAAVGVAGRDFELAGPAIMDMHKQKHLWSGVFPGTADGLASLRVAGYFVAVISNADGTVESLLHEAGVREHLSFVIDSGIVGVEKPEPRIFEMALEKAGVSAEESYYVGDIYPIDVVGARSVGMTPVLVDPLGRYGDRDCRTITDVAAFCRELVSARVAA